MSNKLALATIQFNADAKGANAALESMRQSAKDAEAKVNELQAALDKGITTMKDANGVEFNVADALKRAKTEAKSFNDGIAQLIKGATALEAVVKNIRLGEIEKNTRGELVGAMNAINARRRNLAEEKTPDYAERKKDLDDMEAEIKKQINRIDHDTERVLQTLRDGGTVSQEVIDKEIKGLNELLKLIPKTDEEWKKYNAQLTEIEGHVMKMNEAQLKQTASILGDKNLGQYNENQIRDAIAATKELMKTVETGGDVYNQYAQNIVNAEKHLDQYGVAAERARQKEAAATEKQKQKEQELSETMNKRMRSLTTLSADALSETRKYWEAQRNGAERGTEAFNKAEEALKRITNQERKRKVESLDKILGDPSKFGITEVKNAVQEMERLRDSVQKGIPQWQHYNKMVNEGKAYLDNLAKSEAAQRIEAQMKNITTLSATGLTEVKKYWETMVAGAARGSDELKLYEANLKRVTAEEQARANADAQKRVGILNSGNLGGYSEAEIRKAIEAGNQLIKTYQTASPEAKALAQNIVNAENHLKQYGVEAERAAQKEAKAVADAAKKRQDADTEMRKQLYNSKELSESALKAQQQYWQRLIDDPKTAAASLARYKKDLAEVKRLQEQMTAEKGEAALRFFRGDTSNASASQIQENAKALKTYRDSLPQQSQADVINEINGYLQQAGVSAEKAAEKTMSLTNALKLAGTAGTSGFRGTAEDLQLAQKAIEQAISTTDKGTAKYERLQQALARIKAEMAWAGISSQKMQQVLANPKGERSVDNLKNAVARARAEMEVTAQRAERLQRLIDAIGNSKNKDAHKDLLKNLRQSLKATSAEYNTLAKSTANAEKQQRVLEGQSKNTASAFEKAWSRLKTYVGVYVSAAVAMQKVISTFSKVNELSDKMGEVGKTTGLTNEQLAHLQESLSRISTRTAMNELMSLSAAAGQLGLKTEQDVMAFTRAANMITVALPEMGREGVTELMKIAQATGTVEDLRRQIQAGLIDDNNAVEAALTRVGSTIDALRANSASTAPRITDFVKRVGAVGAQSKISIDQIAALGSTVDALGMRTEMAATALARMIPAIKNNAFAISQAINIAPDEIVRMYEAGDAMQVIVKLLRAMNGKGEEEIEGMLNQRGFGEILKALNQQGARAGQVFAGLAQNVGELERQLDIAHDAFEENIAIQNEYNRMNETTAGKLAKLGNTLTNFFATAGSSKFLGTVYDFLNWFFTNWINNPKFYFFFNTLLGYLAVTKIRLYEIAAQGLSAGIKGVVNGFKLMYDSLRNAFGAAKDLKTGLDLVDKKEKAMALKNAWTAIATALVLAGKALYDWWKEARKVEEISKEAMSRVASEVEAATSKVDDFFKSVGNARVAITDAKDEVQKAEKALEEAKKASDGSRESADKLAKAETDLKVANEKLTIANDAHYASIRKINEQYSPYLGYMLSEISTAAEVANARDLINAKLRETILLKQQESAYGRIEEEFGGKRDEKRQDLYGEIEDAIKNPEQAARVRKDLNALIKKYREVKLSFAIPADEEWNEFRAILKPYNLGYTDYSDIQGAFRNLLIQEKKIYKARKLVEDDIKAELKAARTGTENTKGTQKELEEQLEAIEKGNKELENGYKNSLENLEAEYKKADDKHRKQIAAKLLQQMDAYETLLNDSKNYFDLKEEDEEESYKELITKGDKRMAELRKQREQLVKEAGDAYKAIQTGTNGVTSPTVEPKIWGEKPTAESPYSEWNADDLVARRKSMLTFVRALQDDTDIQTVLKQDEAFQKAYAAGLIKNTRDAIDWYNAERMKIQDELHKRHLTNTGDWDTPKAGTNKKMKETNYALAELDRYYAWRKEKIEDARIEEGLTEVEYNKRIETLEQEHLQKRSDLRTTFTHNETREEKAFVKQFREWWDSVKELDDVEWKKIENEWATKANASNIGTNNKEAQKDLTQMKGIVMKQMKAIEDIIAKERPFDGITKNLEENLTKLDILFTKAERENGIENFMDKRTERLSFLLKEAENAYSLSAEQLLQQMREHGLDEWADAIASDENADKLTQALLAQLHEMYDEVQNAIKKEASLIKKQTDIWWSDVEKGQTQSRKGSFESVLSALGLQEDQVKRANSLINAGQASQRVADKLAIKQMQVQLAMQQTYYNRMRQIGEERIRQLEAAERYEDAEHLRRSLNLSLTKEQAELDKQRVAIANQLEESQNRLYTELRDWASLISSSLQSVFEASNTGNAEYYNEKAKLALTGETKGSQQYIIIDNAGTSDATAHYETLSETQALERQHEIEQQNAVADAWKKVMDDINQKMNDMITDQMNAMLQNQSIDANTQATIKNTEAILAMTAQMGGEAGSSGVDIDTSWASKQGLEPGSVAGENNFSEGTPTTETPTSETPSVFLPGQEGGFYPQMADDAEASAERQVAAIDKVQYALDRQFHSQEEGSKKTNKEMAASAQSAFAKMTQAANLYGIAYQAMSNDNMSASQKFGMIAVQAAGNAAITALTVNMAETNAQTASDTPSVLSKLWKQLGWGAIPVFAIFTGLLGGLMGLAASKIAKSKSEIASATGAGNSVASGRLTTGMLTYAEGNVNEFTDPGTLTPGKSYNVDAADGKTYRAKYTGRNPKTHITNGPEFHLAGEAGREMIIDAGTTRQITMNEREIFHAIQTLSGGGRLRRSSLRKGIGAFADGNLDDFEDLDNSQFTIHNSQLGGSFDAAAMQASLDRNSAIQEALLERLSQPIVALNKWDGPDGIPNMYNQYQKKAQRYGQKYL